MDLKGACTKITLKPNGAPFTLGQYMSISINGIDRRE